MAVGCDNVGTSNKGFSNKGVSKQYMAVGSLPAAMY